MVEYKSDSDIYWNSGTDLDKYIIDLSLVLWTSDITSFAAATGKQQYTGGGTETGYLTKLECSGSSGGFAAWYNGTDIEIPEHDIPGHGDAFIIDTQNGARSVYLWQRGGISGVTVKATYTSPNGGTYIWSIPTSEWHYDGETSDGDGTDYVIISGSNGNVPKQASWK